MRLRPDNHHQDGEQGSTLVEALVGISLILLLVGISATFASTQMQKLQALGSELLQTAVLAQVQRDLNQAASTIYIQPWWPDTSVTSTNTYIRAFEPGSVVQRDAKTANEPVSGFNLWIEGEYLHLESMMGTHVYHFPWVATITEVKDYQGPGRAFVLTLESGGVNHELHVRLGGICTIKKQSF